MNVSVAHSRYRHPGGEERHIDLLVAELERTGHSVERIDIEVNEVPLRQRIGLAATLAYRPSAGRMMAQRLQRRPADVVHFHNITPHLTTAALRAAKASGAHVVLTLHNFRFACPAGTLLRRGRRHDDCIRGSSLVCGLRGAREPWIESVAYGAALELQRRLRLLTRWVDAFVTPASHLRDTFLRAGGPPARTHVIPYGVPLPPVADGSGAYALFAGRLSGEKGVQTLLEAAKQTPQIPFVVAGDGPLSPLLEQSPENVEWLGPVSHARVAELRRDAAFVVTPSEWPEILPFAAIEAIADGRPVVATRTEGLSEIVDDGVTGLLVGERDPDDLAAACARMWDGADVRRRMGLAARAAAEQRFELETQTARVAALYERLSEHA